MIYDNMTFYRFIINKLFISYDFLNESYYKYF